MWKRITEHPGVSALVGAAVATATAIAIWSGFSAEPPIPLIGEWLTTEVRLLRSPSVSTARVALMTVMLSAWGFVAYVTLTTRLRPATEPLEASSEAPASPREEEERALAAWTFAPARVTTTIASLTLIGFGGVRRGNEAFIIRISVHNWSGSRVRVTAVEGAMTIGTGAPEASPLRISQGQNTFIPDGTDGMIELTQPVPNFDLGPHGFLGKLGVGQQGLWGKQSVVGFNLSSLRFLAQAERPDASHFDTAIRLAEKHFTIHGPVRAGYGSDLNLRLERANVTFGLPDYYDADMTPTDRWINA